MVTEEAGAVNIAGCSGTQFFACACKRHFQLPVPASDEDWPRAMLFGQGLTKSFGIGAALTWARCRRCPALTLNLLQLGATHKTRSYTNFCTSLTFVLVNCTVSEGKELQAIDRKSEGLAHRLLVQHLAAASRP